MARHEKYVRERIPTEGYRDLGGRTAIRPGAGRFPTRELFPLRTVYNLDGSVTEPVPEGGLISKVPICDICFRPMESIKDLTKRGNHWVCRDCYDEGPPRYPFAGHIDPLPAPDGTCSLYLARDVGELYNIGDGNVWERGCASDELDVHYAQQEGVWYNLGDNRSWLRHGR
jgi:hypothetical protein